MMEKKQTTEILGLEILSEISRIANSTLDLKARLESIVSATAERMGKDAAAISLLDKEEKHLILKASKGLAPEAVDQVVLNVGEGITGWVALEKRPLALADAQADPRFKYFAITGEERYRSMLAVPVMAQNHCIGVLAVNTVAVWEYSQDEITLLSTIANDVGGIIRNAQLYQDVNQRLLELTAIYDIGQALTSTLDLETVLRMIIKNSIAVLKAKGGVLRLLDPDTQLLVVKASSVPEYDERRLAPLRIGEGIAGRIAQSGAPILITHLEESELRGISFVAFSSVMGVPIRSRDRIIGTITLYDKTSENSVTTASFSHEDLQLLSTLGSQAAIAIENAKLYQQTLKSAKEMETLYSLSKGMTSVLDLYFVLDSILRMIGDVLEAEYGILTLFDEGSGELQTKSLWGADSALLPHLRFPLGEGTTGRIAQKKESLLLDQIDPTDKKLQYLPLKNLIGVPLMVKDRLIGTIEIANKRTAPSFSTSDLMLLSTFAGQAAVAIENANLYEKTKRLAEENEKRVRELSILYEIGSTMRSTLELTHLLHIILTGVTIGGGLGFNRAILFLVNEKENLLNGVMGVGPENQEDARRVWGAVPVTGNLRERILQDEDVSLHQRSTIHQLATQLHIPIVEGGGVLALTVLEKRPYNIHDSRDDPRVNPILRDTIKTESFATAPLIAKNKVMGAIFVDNHFTKKPITEEDIRFLLMFANQAGLAIENAMIYSNLEETNKSLRQAQELLLQKEKLATIGEMATGIAHEIRNPLVSLGGFARRLRDRTQSDELARKYADIIYKETDRLEKILREILSFSKETSPSLAPTDINVVITDILTLFRDQLAGKNVEVLTELSDDLPRIQADPQQLKQVFINLFSNAEQAMEKGGKLFVATRISEETSFEIQVEVSNTGPGIPREVMANIFNPFFTTKSMGTGLGLTIVHRIITSHGGRILVHNRSEGGVSFLIFFPVEIR